MSPIRIPTVSREIGLDTPRLSTPDMPNIPRAAFGEQVAQANMDATNAVMNPLIKRAQERVDFDNKQFDDQVQTQFLNDLQDQLLSQEEITVQRGKDRVKIPKGYLNRQGINAEGITGEFSKWSSENMPKYLQNIKDPDRRAALSNKMQGYLRSSSQDIIGHQVKQDRIYKQGQAESAITTKAQFAAGAKTADELRAVISDMGETRDGIDGFNGVDADTNALNKQKDAVMAVESNLDALMAKDVTGELAMQRLNEMTELSDDNKVKFEKGIKTRVKENAQTAINDIDGAIIGGDATVDMVMQAQPLIGNTEAKRKIKEIEAIQKNSLKDIDYEDIKVANKFMETVDLMVSDRGDQFTLRQQFIDMIADNVLSKEEAQTMNKLTVELGGDPEKKSLWSNVVNVTKGAWASLSISDNDKRMHINSLFGATDVEAANQELLRNEYNKTFPEQPLSKEENPLNPPLEKDIKHTPLLERLGKGYGMGVTGMLEGAAGVAGWAGLENVRKSVKSQVDLMKDFYEIPDPDFTYYLAGGIASGSTFLLPGIGIARGANALRAFPAFARVLGISASTLLESTIQAGSDYEGALNKGMSPKMASGNATKSFWLNIPTLALTNAMGGLFGVDKGGAIAKALKSAPMEGVQEFTQELISQVLVNDVQLQPLVQSALIGGIVGGGMGLTAAASDNLGDLKDTKKVFDDLKTKLQNERGSIEIGGGTEGEITGGDIVEQGQNMDAGGQDIQVTGGQVVEQTKPIVTDIQNPDQSQVETALQQAGLKLRGIKTGKDSLVPSEGATIYFDSANKSTGAVSSAKLTPEWIQQRMIQEKDKLLNSAKKKMAGNDQIQNFLESDLAKTMSKEKLDSRLEKYKEKYKLTDEEEQALVDDIVGGPSKTNLSNEKGQVSITGKPPIPPTQTAQGQSEPVPNPVQKVVQALKAARPMRAEQEQLYKQERGKRFNKAFEAGQAVKGEKGYYATLSQLKGDLPKVQFESIRSKLTDEDIDGLFEMIRTSKNIKQLDQLAAGKGLAKLLGEFGGNVPTENELMLMKRVFGHDLVDTLTEMKPTIDKIKEAGYQLFNIPRSIMSSFDLSAPLRQGLFFIGRSKQFLPAYFEMFKAFGSEQGFKAIERNIANKPSFDLMIESGLALTDMDGTLELREEKFMSNWAENIPVIGKGVRASGRAYVGFLNKLRADVFEEMVNQADKLGLDPYGNPELSKGIANYINNATGRGSLGALESSAVALNTFFFSPRLIASRLNLLNPAFYVSQTPFVRTQALKDLFTFSSIFMTTLALAAMAGADVEGDPRNADFGKIRIRNTRFDIAGGFLQYLRLASQLWTGEIISSTTGKKFTLGEGYKPITRLDILGRSIEYKESPMVSFATNLLRGSDALGDKASVDTEVKKLFTPMVVSSLYDLAQQDPELLPFGVVGAFGVGVQTYSAKSKSKSKRKIKAQ